MRKGFHYMLAVLLAGMYFCSCKSLQTVNEIPADVYIISSKGYTTLDSGLKRINSQGHINIDVEETDGELSIKPVSEKSIPRKIKMSEISDLKIYRYTFDVEILTIPFKIRPSVMGFPQQLNPNFSAAVYLGHRRDSYRIRSLKSRGTKKFKVSGVGYGYGGFIGLGAVTMNPFVTEQQIDYEYDGFVINCGFAGIYDAKKFNLGLAIGADYLMDKNQTNWIYQGRPWFGLLFGINLN